MYPEKIMGDYKAQMLKTLKQNLKARCHLVKPQPIVGEKSLNAAVLVVLCGDNDYLELLLTVRSEHVNRHRGEVAFPGGMWQGGDDSLLETALREAEEEVGVRESSLELLATLQSSSPLQNHITVAPFIAYMTREQKLIAQPSEISQIFRVPIQYLMNKRNYCYFKKNFDGKPLSLPHIDYNGHRIWGFTLKVLVDLLNIGLDAEIHLCFPFKTHNTN